MKILIADDERLVRVSIRSMIEEINLSDCFMYECRNGKETVETIKETKPDIAFIDIRMPLLNGLSAIEECLNLAKETAFVIITGFSEFEYAKKSIELGVYDYLLKPIKPEKLNQVISKIIEKKRIRLYEENVLFQKSILELYYNENFVDERQYYNLQDSCNYAVISFLTDNEMNMEELKKLNYCLIENTEAVLVNMINEGINAAKLNISSNSITFILKYKTIDSGGSGKFIRRLIDAYRQYDENLKLTSITSSSIVNFREIKDRIELIKKVGLLRIVLGIDRDYSLGELMCYYEDKASIELCEILEEMSQSLKNNMYIRLCNLLEKLEKTIIINKQLVTDKKSFQNINSFLRRSIDFIYDKEYSIEWISKLYTEKDKLSRKLSKNRDITDQIMDFINTNYMSELSTNNLSEIFNLTPNYLSTLFHKRTNMKLVDYIAKVRIIKAQDLLTETNMTVSEICESIGYHSTRYFNKLFKKLSGQSPLEYRKSIK